MYWSQCGKRSFLKKRNPGWANSLFVLDVQYYTYIRRLDRFSPRLGCSSSGPNRPCIGQLRPAFHDLDISGQIFALIYIMYLVYIYGLHDLLVDHVWAAGSVSTQLLYILGCFRFTKYMLGWKTYKISLWNRRTPQPKANPTQEKKRLKVAFGPLFPTSK